MPKTKTPAHKSAYNVAAMIDALAKSFSYPKAPSMGAPSINVGYAMDTTGAKIIII